MVDRDTNKFPRRQVAIIVTNFERYIVATFVGGSWDDCEFILRLKMWYTFDRVINRNPIEFHLFTRLEANFKGDSQRFRTCHGTWNCNDRVSMLSATMSICNSKGKWSRNDCVTFIEKRGEFILLKNSFCWLNSQFLIGINWNKK